MIKLGEQFQRKQTADGEFVRAPLVGELAAFPPPPLAGVWTGGRPAELRERSGAGRGQRAQRPLGGLARAVR